MTRTILKAENPPFGVTADTDLRLARYFGMSE